MAKRMQIKNWTGKSEHSISDPYADLANAIVLQAIKDYADMVCCQCKRPLYWRRRFLGAARQGLDALEFFKSGRSLQYTELEPEFLIKVGKDKGKKKFLQTLEKEMYAEWQRFNGKE